VTEVRNTEMGKELSYLVGADGKMVTANNPLVSIITPVLNGIKYLEECIWSVLNQTYPSIEHVFIDGGSTDGTLEVLTRHQSQYPDKIRLIIEPNKSAEEAWNFGLRAARGGILGWLGSDDVFEPNAIVTVLEFFQANPDAYFVYGGCKLINDKDEILDVSMPKEFDLDRLINETNYISCPSAFYKRAVVEKVGFMDTSIHSCDLDYWIRVGKIFPMHRIEIQLSNFRLHRGSTSGAEGADKMYAREGFIICRRYGGSLFSPRARRYYRLVIADSLRPVCGFAYPFLGRAHRYYKITMWQKLRPVIDRLRPVLGFAYPFLNKALKLLP
jgi:glycosyltransferase involved in cell wall biosynthesis